MVEEFFNTITRENAGRALHAQAPLVYEEARTKWQRILESHAANVGDTEPTASGSGTSAFRSGNGVNSGGGGGGGGNRGKGRGGTPVRGRGARGAYRGGSFAPNNSGRLMVRSTYQGPPAILNGIRACYGFNDDARPCTRQMRDATTCADATGRDVFVHCCSFWDPASKKHCFSLNHGKTSGNH